MPRILLVKSRIFKTLLVIFIILGFFANGVMAEACFCGEACLHSLQDKTKASTASPFHHRCSGTHCKSCNLEDGQTLRATNSSTPTGSLNILDTSLIILFLTDYHSDNHTILSFYPHNDTFLKLLSSTIYILNLSLLI
jgi:hypothetical protein